MTTAFYSHPSFLQHDTGSGHPESAARLQSILKALDAPAFVGLARLQAPAATQETLRLIHTQAHIDRVLKAIPQAGYVYLDPDTVVSPGSGEAALFAVGAVCAAVDTVFADTARNAFCAVRPPGHHAEPDKVMGFCLFNNIAIAAQHARQKHGIKRVAIIDFDVHHGNGTQAAFERNPQVLYASTHQSPWYPGTGQAHETGVGNIFNVPLAAGGGSEVFRAAMQEKILPAVDRFQPELMLVSAGFDAHRDDPLASLSLEDADYAWITMKLADLADQYCNGRLISALEGGYHLDALASSVSAHVEALLKASNGKSNPK